jgi:virginiamycin B lyase
MPLAVAVSRITTTPDGQQFYASLAGSHIGCIHHRTDAAEVLEPPTGDQGARRSGPTPAAGS